ncbi:MAG: Uncharacterised protein [Cyanobium sp. ARS6]|nr:MAG: Uncharacterised protein [Cyanobium sp. ARS6]
MGLAEQHLQLLIGQRHVRPHQDKPRKAMSIGIAAPKLHQLIGLDGLRTKWRAAPIHQSVNQTRSGAKQKAAPSLQRLHCSPECIQLLLPLGIHDH